MPRQVVVDNEFMSLWYYPEAKIIHHEFHRFMHGDHFRDGLTRGAETLEAHGATKWLSDDRKNSALLPEDREWGDTTWFPRVLRAGWKHWAIVLPAKVIGQMNMQSIIDDFTEKGINARIFGDPEAAMAWLEKQ